MTTPGEAGGKKSTGIFFFFKLMQKDILDPHVVLSFYHTGFNTWKGNSYVLSVKFACGVCGNDLRALRPQDTGLKCKLFLHSKFSALINISEEKEKKEGKGK